MTVKKIEKLMKQVDCENIKMKNLQSFINNFTEDKNKCESLESKEIKELHKSWLNIGKTVADLYLDAKSKYIKKINEMKEDYMFSESECEKKEKETDELKKDIKRKYKELRKINDIDERSRRFHEISSYEKLIKHKQLSLNISRDFNRAGILATFDIFNDLSKSVDEAYSKDEYIDNKVIIESLKDIILLMIGKINPVTELIIDASDIIKAISKITESVDAGKQMNNSIDLIDKGIKQLKERRVNMVLALLAIKVYLEDMEYLYKVFGNSVDE